MMLILLCTNSDASMIMNKWTFITALTFPKTIEIDTIFFLALELWIFSWNFLIDNDHY